MSIMTSGKVRKISAKFGKSQEHTCQNDFTDEEILVINPKKFKVSVKVQTITRIIETLIGDQSELQLMTILSHLNKHARNQRKEPLSRDEAIVYDWMLRNSLKPNTVYSWFLQSRSPEYYLKRTTRFNSRILENLGKQQINKTLELAETNFLNRARRFVELNKL